jgi:hypothetical protein
VDASGAGARPDESDGAEPPGKRATRLWFSVAISVGAIALAVAHLVWPDAQLDSVTLVLLAIALLPWLGAIFQSVKLPWVEVQYWKQLQLVQERANHLDSRLAAVETQMFRIAGATAAQGAALDDVLRTYAKHLDTLGLTWDADALPTITVDAAMGPDAPPGIYVPGTNLIVLAPDAVDDAAVALRQYTHWVLVARAGLGMDIPIRVWVLEDGLADYFVASHLGDPVLASRTARQRRRPFYRRLSDPPDFDALPKHRTSWGQPEPNPWGNLFWAIRGIVGPEPCDALLASSWLATTPGRTWDRRFVANVIERTPEDASAAVIELLGRCGLV